MTIRELIELLETEDGYTEINIYDSSGDMIEPKSFSYGAKQIDGAFVDTVSFSELE